MFHELARHLQTRRLIAGDTLSLDQDKSFYCVIDGSVQVYARTGLPNQTVGSGSWDEDDMNGYQLLNQVGSGGMLSSLFTILSLFTENVKLSWQDEDYHDDDDELEPVSVASTQRTPLRRRPGRSNSDVSNLSLGTMRSPTRRPSVSSSASTVHQEDVKSPRAQSPYRRSQSPLPFPQSSRIPSGTSTRPKSTVSAEPESHFSAVARAAEDSSLAVIPAEAFRRLTKKFPKATAHIVQGEVIQVPFA